VTEIGLPILFCIFIWWFSTGAILYLDGLKRSTFSFSMMMASFVAAIALGALWWIRDTTDTTSAYVGFTASLMIWGWNEMAFLMGYITGPRRVPSDGRATGWRRFQEASETIISHEIAIALSALAIGLVSWGSTNMVGFWTFMILWVMRLSTKFNIFLGAPNVTDEFLPEHLSYLSSYFRRRPMNGLFPLVITVSTLVTVWLTHMAIWVQGTAFDTIAYTLLASLMALAVLEHWLLFIPLPTSWLWRWGLRDRATPVRLSPGNVTPVTINSGSTQDMSPGSLTGRRSGIVIK
jgi:putative photosynthetic complex assembly protein 2